MATAKAKAKAPAPKAEPSAGPGDDGVLDLGAARAARRETSGVGPRVGFAGRVFQLRAEVPLRYGELVRQDRYSEACALLLADPDEDLDDFLALDLTIHDLMAIATQYAVTQGESSAS